MKTESNKAAFPCADNTLTENSGLTKRELFAMAAMQGIISDQTYVRPNQGREVALRAVELADALIDELNKEPK